MIQTLNDAETANENRPPIIIDGAPLQYWQASKESATARRASMDLTRALAQLRQP